MSGVSGRAVSFPIRFPSLARCCPPPPERRAGGPCRRRGACLTASRRSCPPPAARWGSLGASFTDQCCVTAAWPREFLRYPKPRQASRRPPSRVPSGAGRKQHPWAVGAAQTEREKDGPASSKCKKSRGARSKRERHYSRVVGGTVPARVRVPRRCRRAVRGEASPAAAGAAVASALGAAPAARCGASRPSRRGLGARGGARLGGSLSPLARPVLPRQGRRRGFSLPAGSPPRGRSV